MTQTAFSPTGASPALHPRGGALVFVLLLCGVFATCAACFMLLIEATVADADSASGAVAVQAGIDSAVQHASYLLAEDLWTGPADSYKDCWAASPSGGEIEGRGAWIEYAAGPDRLTNQHVFCMPGPQPGTTIRYRFKLVDCQPGAGATSGVQPFVSAAWRDGRWLPTADINAVDPVQFGDLLSAFEPRATSDQWRAEAVARFIDSRDDNFALSDPALPDTEAVQFERVAASTDTRWNHLDDTLRLGRYYEERPDHNFFLIADWRLRLDRQTGRSNVVVTLDPEPCASIPGWPAYRDLRSRAGLSRWPTNFWRDATGVTGSGSLLKRQRTVACSAESLTFEDDEPRRYEAVGGIRQTVTFQNWFSSLNTYARYDAPGSRDRGSLVTLKPRAMDSVFLTNMSAGTPYQAVLYTGGRMSSGTRASAGMGVSLPTEPLEFSEDGAAVLAHVFTVEKRQEGAATELLFRSPDGGVSAAQPFYLESAVLRQPAFIVLRNASEAPAILRGWRLGYACGGQMVWTDPFTTSRYHVADGTACADTLPSIPPRGQVVVTPDASLFDLFAGTRKSGTWGDAEGEQTPVIETGWASWTALFAVGNARAAREHSMPGSSGTEHPWETDWTMTLDVQKELMGDLRLDDEAILFDPDGPGENHGPVPGVIVEHDGVDVTIRIAGGMARFCASPEATLRLQGVPRDVREFWLALPDGRMAARVALPRRTEAERATVCVFARGQDNQFVAEPVDWSLPALPQAAHTSRHLPVVRNSACTTVLDKTAMLADIGIAHDDDWYLGDAVYRSCADGGIECDPSVRWSLDTATVSGVEKGYYTLTGPRLDFPAGPPGLLYGTARFEDGWSLRVREMREGGFAADVPPGPAPPTAHSVVRLGPSMQARGIHVFGGPGPLIVEWRSTPVPSRPVRVLLAGRSARQWTPSRTLAQWHAATSDVVLVSVSIWNPTTRQYEPCAARRGFDAADRLDCGMVTPACFSNGCVRMRIETHEKLEPSGAALWLQGVYLQSLAERHVANVNTLSPRALAALCRGGEETAAAILGAQHYPATSIASLAGACPRPVREASVDLSALAVRSDLFDCCIEVEVLKCGMGSTNVVTRAVRRLRLDRSAVRLDRRQPVRHVSDGIAARTAQPRTCRIASAANRR